MGQFIWLNPQILMQMLCLFAYYLTFNHMYWIDYVRQPQGCLLFCQPAEFQNHFLTIISWYTVIKFQFCSPFTWTKYDFYENTSKCIEKMPLNPKETRQVFQTTLKIYCFLFPSLIWHYWFFQQQSTKSLLSQNTGSWILPP